MNLLDNSNIEFACPHCGKKAKKRIGSVQNDKVFTCPGCGKVSDLDTTGLRKSLKSSGANQASLKAALRKFGK